MRRNALVPLALLAAFLSAGSVLAQQSSVREPVIPADNVKLVWHIPRYIAAPQPKGVAKVGKVPGPFADPLAIYSNVDTATGNAFNNFIPIAPDGSFTAIRADDATFTTFPSVGNIAHVILAVYNGSGAAITATVRCRTWLDNGSGAPGTFYTGFTSNPIAFADGVSAYDFNLGATPWPVPSPGSTVTMWLGQQFTADFASDAAELGMFLIDPPGVGSSSDVMFAGDTAATMYGVNNPTGSTFNFGAAPVANAYFELRVSVLPVDLKSFTAE